MSTEDFHNVQNPLETLVVAELAEIRRRENALQTHLAGRLTAEPGLNSTTVAHELAQLQTMADRLSRMMDAMSSPFARGSVEGFASAHAS